jgi:hypothetical protein
MEHFEELKKFKDLHGHCNVPSHCKENPRLASWVHTLRDFKKKGKLDSQREKILVDLGLKFDLEAAKDGTGRGLKKKVKMGKKGAQASKKTQKKSQPKIVKKSIRKEAKGKKVA